MGEEEREWTDSLIDAARRDIAEYLHVEEDSQVFEIIRESIKRLEEV